MNIQEIITKVKQNKKYSSVHDSFVQKNIELVIRRNPNLTLDKKKHQKEIIKETRALLRRSVVSFNPESYNRDNLLEEHKSTAERLPDYSTLSKIITDINPSSILDLGCGLNPLALAKKGIEYTAYDIDEKIIQSVRKFFDEKGIHGKAIVADITQESSFPKSDLILILKVVDLLDKKGHKETEKLINKLNGENIIISFSTKTLSGKSMNYPQRGWIERLLKRLGYSFSIIKTKNELFYKVKGTH